jgi:hypothetical protein
MAGFGDVILKMMGQKDPRLALMASMTGGGTPGAPAPAGGAPAAGGTDPGTAAPSAPAQPQAYTSPPELMELYTQLLDRQRRESLIDNGIGMLGSAFAYPENRGNIMRAFTSGGGGSSGGSDPMGMVMDVMKMQQMQSAVTQKAAQRAALPAIANQYGIDLPTAQYLFDTGKLDSVLADALKPDNQIVTNSDGTSVIVDKRTGKIGEAFGPKKAREIEIVKTDRGDQFAVYKDTGERVGTENIVSGQGATENEQLWRADEADRKDRGLPTRSLSEFIEQTGRARAGAANLGPNGVDYGTPPKDMAWKRDAQGSIAVDEQGRPMAVPIAGGPMDIAAKEKEQQDAGKAGSSEATSTFMVQKVKDALDVFTKNKDSWTTPLTGMAGAAAQYIPGTEANQLSSELTTLKANLGFEKLQAMRENSPTGGALGQVSDFENKLLQSTFGDLSLTLKPEVLIRNLFRVEALTDTITRRGIKNPGAKEEPGANRATQEEVFADADRRASEFLKTLDSKSPGQGGGSGVEDLLKKYGGQ